MKKSLKDLFNEVKEGIEKKLKSSDNLKEIKSVIYGEKYRIGNLQSPAIWIVPNPYTPDLKGGHSVDHDFTFDFVTLVKTPRPEEGLIQAQDLAFTVYDVFTKDRTLGGVVHDIRPLRVDPAYEAGESTQLCYSAVQLAFRVKRRE